MMIHGNNQDDPQVQVRDDLQLEVLSSDDNPQL